MGRSVSYLGGIGLVLALAGLLALPLWLRSGDHPLSGEASLDACTLLANEMRTGLPEQPVDVAPQPPERSGAGVAECVATFAPRRGANPGSRYVRVTVSTQRMLSQGGHPVRTDRFVQTWLTEAKASGSDVQPIEGPWRSAALIRDPGRPKIDLLADDAGVVLLVSSVSVDAQSLVNFAGAAARRLRTR
jgi:hypothetical protein